MTSAPTTCSLVESTCPPTVIRCLPTVPTPTSCRPGSSSRTVVRRRSATAGPGTSRSQPGQSVTSVVTSTVPSASSSSPSAPGWPSGVVQRPARSSAGGSRRDTAPGCTSTSTSPNASRSAASGVGRAVRTDVRGAAALHERVDGVGAEQGDPGDVVGGDGQRVLVVAEHHHRAGRPARAARRARRRRPRGRAGRPDGSTPSRAPTRWARRSRRRTLASSSASLTSPDADGVEQPVAPRSVGSGHLQVEAALGGRDDGGGGHPVAHHDAVEAPLVLEHPGEQRAVLGGGRGGGAVVDPGVRAHDRPRLRLVHQLLERRQVHLAQRPLVDARQVGGALRSRSRWRRSA